MTSATDIITYVGIPLAVLGVSPILYTLLRAVLTLRSVRRTLLRHGHVPATNTSPDGFTTRSSPMTSLIEVDLPRYTIAPLDRGDPAYWKLGTSSFEGDRHALLRTESTLSMVDEGRVQGFLRGGSWRTFHWRKLVVGRKLYRIQWEDELREPPAEIDFSDLIHFLMDWGAVPDARGWETLRQGGLWTPGGTVLLRRDDTGSQKVGVDWVLRTSVPDESDGVLSLAVRWNTLEGSAGSDRGVASLPPGWARIRQPGKSTFSSQVEEKGLVGRIEQARRALPSVPESEGARFCIEGTYVSAVSWEHGGIVTGEGLQLWPEHSENGCSLWFTCAASALSRRKQYGGGGGFWGFDMPSHINNFVRKESIACGVMVTLGLIAEIDTPAWSTNVNVPPDASNPAMRQHRRFLERQRRMQEERTMAPEQARVARMNRETEERLAIHDDMMADARQRIEREEHRLKEALSSPKLSNKAVAEACLAWMIDQAEIDKDSTLWTLAEAVLYLLIVDQRPNGEAARIVEVLDEWQIWAQHGGLKKSHITFLAESKVEFCCAAALVHIIEEAVSASGHSGEVMKECVRSWRKVRLG
jgi:hypothetical protein